MNYTTKKTKKKTTTRSTNPKIEPKRIEEIAASPELSALVAAEGFDELTRDDSDEGTTWIRMSLASGLVNSWSSPDIEVSVPTIIANDMAIALRKAIAKRGAETIIADMLTKHRESELRAAAAREEGEAEDRLYMATSVFAGHDKPVTHDVAVYRRWSKWVVLQCQSDGTWLQIGEAIEKKNDAVSFARKILNAGRIAVGSANYGRTMIIDRTKPKSTKPTRAQLEARIAELEAKTKKTK